MRCGRCDSDGFGTGAQQSCPERCRADRPTECPPRRPSRSHRRRRRRLAVWGSRRGRCPAQPRSGRRASTVEPSRPARSSRRRERPRAANGPDWRICRPSYRSGSTAWTLTTRQWWAAAVEGCGRSSACPRSPMPLTPASRRPNRRHPSRRVPPAAPQVAATGEAYRTCPHRSLAGGWVDGRGAVKRVAAGVNVVGGTCYPPRVLACARVPAALRIEF